MEGKGELLSGSWVVKDGKDKDLGEGERGRRRVEVFEVEDGLDLRGNRFGFRSGRWRSGGGEIDGKGIDRRRLCPFGRRRLRRRSRSRRGGRC